MFLLSSGSGSKSLIVYEKTQYFFLKKWRIQGEETIKYHFDSSTDYWHHMNSFPVSLTLELWARSVINWYCQLGLFVWNSTGEGRKGWREWEGGKQLSGWCLDILIVIPNKVFGHFLFETFLFCLLPQSPKHERKSGISLSQETNILYENII